ncbi:MAG: SDR family oxidoreductase [Pseudomonadota bacterium]
MAWTHAVDRWIGARPLDDPLSPDPESGLVGAVVVTGGSDGIGYEIARVCAERGQRVVLIARGAGRLREAVRKLRDAVPNSAVSMVTLDVTDADAPQRLLATLSDEGLSCEVLVNNAGAGLSGAFIDAEPDDVAALLDVNVAAVTRLTHAVLPAMVRAQRGGVLNIASFGGLVPGPYQAAYYASKAFTVSLTEGLAWELRGRGVRIACLAPGPVETSFHARMDAQTALYRRVLPAMTPRRVARAAIAGFYGGRTLIVPGILFAATGLLLRIVPRKMQAAATGGLLKPRGAERRAA